MNCREFVDFLMRFLDGELSADEQRVFEQHMKDCPPCGEYLESYRHTVRVGFSVCQCSEDELPADVPEELVKAILEARKQGGPQGG